MSRIGMNPIDVPNGVNVSISEDRVEVTGPKGTLAEAIPPRITVRAEGDTLLVERTDDAGDSRAKHGLIRSLIYNMIVGVSEGFTKELDIQGVGFRATLAGQDLDLSLGFSHPVKVAAPEGISFEVPTPNRVKISGASKQAVGQIAADIRAIRKPEPYKGKGVRYLGERVARKAGKAAK